MALAGAGYGLQVQGWMFNVFITSRIYPTLDEKKKDIHYVPVKEQALLIIYLCPVTQPKKLNKCVISFVL